MTIHLPQRWTELCRGKGRDHDPTLLQHVYQELVLAYSIPRRFHHTLAHIEDCLEELDGARHHARNPRDLELALWLHDAVYDPHKKDNEERSVDLAYRLLATLVDRTSLLRIGKMILATEHRVIPTDDDEKFIVDIDLSILGKPEAIFDAYERGIRAEYDFVEESQFRRGRADILERFLTRKPIYLTDHFIAKYQAQAERNLTRSIARLRDE